MASVHVEASFNLNLSSCFFCRPLPEYGASAPHRHRFERKRTRISALMLAVFTAKGAQPYSQSCRVVYRNIAELP
ncbi:MAG: hypothetical protein KAF91_04685 [Nostoc sp. TH1S01]|nr:hypothetical protein [Nostoc sp. TH1S01]